MTTPVANVALSNTFDYWRTQTNILADAMSTKVLTINGGTPTGNSGIVGSFRSNTIHVDTIAGGTSAVPAPLSFTTLTTFSVNATFNGGITANNLTVTTQAIVPTPTANTHAATKLYVDTTISGAVGGIDTTAYMFKSANLSDVANTTISRTNLGLGTAATTNTGTTVGTIPVLGTGGFIETARISGSYTGITGTGALTVGSIGSGFGNINIGSSTFTGNGSGLTTLNASNVSSGILNGDRLPASFTQVHLTAPIASSSTNDVFSFEVRNNGGTGDANLASMRFHATGQYGTKINLRADGTFGFGGNSASAWRWYVNMANGDMTAAGNVTAYSDPRLKDDVEVIESALDIIDQLRGVRFTWNHRSTLIGSPGKRDIGILADEVYAVLPEIVSTSVEDPDTDETFQTVDYSKLTPVLIEAIKELRDENRVLRERLDKLEGK